VVPDYTTPNTIFLHEWQVAERELRDEYRAQK
jgi:hypothetical protein